jgi:NADP-dependent aldehyde dehydrogenase
VLAEAAFEADRGRPAERRAALLEAVAEEVEALGEVLVERATAETGLPAARIRGERGRTCGQLRMFADVVRQGRWVDARIDTARPDREPAPRPDLRRMRVPLGPVVVFGASNFPLAFSVAGGDTASALAAGCPVVVKAHPAHPGTSEWVGRAVGQAVARTGLHPGTFSLLHTSSPDRALDLVRHPLARAVGFTGSLHAGRALFDAAAARPEPIPVYAEMGSTNPVVVLPGALESDGDAIADGLVASLTLGAGQFCTCPGVVLGVRGPALDRFAARVAAAVAATGPYTLLHAGIREGYEAGLARWGATEGVRVIASGDAAGSEGEGAAVCAATVCAVSAAAYREEDGLREEVFGPATLLVEAEDAADLEATVRALAGHLTGTLWGTDDELAARPALVAALTRRVGRLIVRGFPTGVEVSPAMQHGGPYPATTDARSTSVGTAAIERFARPVCFQGAPEAVLPPELRDGNPRGVWRLVDGALTRDPVRAPGRTAA